MLYDVGGINRPAKRATVVRYYCAYEHFERRRWWSDWRLIVSCDGWVQFERYWTQHRRPAGEERVSWFGLSAVVFTPELTGAGLGRTRWFQKHARAFTEQKPWTMQRIVFDEFGVLQSNWFRWERSVEMYSTEIFVYQFGGFNARDA